MTVNRIQVLLADLQHLFQKMNFNLPGGVSRLAIRVMGKMTMTYTSLETRSSKHLTGELSVGGKTGTKTVSRFRKNN